MQNTAQTSDSERAFQALLDLRKKGELNAHQVSANFEVAVERRLTGAIVGYGHFCRMFGNQASEPQERLIYSEIARRAQAYV